jgi:hypothetical protein
MKQTEQATMTLKLLLVQATRIETEFGNMGDIAKAMRRVVNEALRKDAQATVAEKAKDDALIPVTVDVTLRQAREILTYFGRALKLLNAPADRDIYVLVSKAINESETT